MKKSIKNDFDKLSSEVGILFVTPTKEFLKDADFEEDIDEIAFEPT